MKFKDRNFTHLNTVYQPKPPQSKLHTAPSIVPVLVVLVPCVDRLSARSSDHGLLGYYENSRDYSICHDSRYPCFLSHSITTAIPNRAYYKIPKTKFVSYGPSLRTLRSRGPESRFPANATPVKLIRHDSCQIAR